MGKVKIQNRCIHCLKISECTDDHILPFSYYPSSVPSIIKNQWTAPACQPCNNDLGRDEEKLLRLFGLCLDPESNVSEVGERTLRSLNPEAVEDEKEKEIRGNVLKKVIKQIFPTHGDTKGVFPGFGHHENLNVQEQFGIPIPPELVNRVAIKIIKGIEHKIDKRYIDDSFELKIFFCEEKDVQDIVQMIRKNGKKYSISDGFEFYRVNFEGKYFFYEIRIWNKFVIYGTMQKIYK